MKCLLLYYTGTYNTRYITKCLEERLIKENIEVDVIEMDPSHIEKLDLSMYDRIGLGYPIYAFNAPSPFLKMIKKQKFYSNQLVFIYKNSGETYAVNDASSLSIARYLRKFKIKIENEYHFMMPYNIHFRFEDALIHEMLQMNDKLLEILVYETTHQIPNHKNYKFYQKLVTDILKLQFIGGPVNSIFYHVDKKKCNGCTLCIKDCPTKNITQNKKGKIVFHAKCIMCMRCSFYCPKDAIHIGFLQNWKVNGKYDFEKIKNMDSSNPYITKETKGFFKCYIPTYEGINQRYMELFGDEKHEISKMDV